MAFRYILNDLIDTNSLPDSMACIVLALSGMSLALILSPFLIVINCVIIPNIREIIVLHNKYTLYLTGKSHEHIRQIRTNGQFSN